MSHTRSLEAVNKSRRQVICEQKVALFAFQLFQLKMLKNTSNVEEHRYLTLCLTIFYVLPSTESLLPFEAEVNDLGRFDIFSSIPVLCKIEISLFFCNLNSFKFKQIL